MTRLLIFAQSPPPVHGQSVMVGHLLEGLHETGQINLENGSTRSTGASIAYLQVNPQISGDLQDIGRWRPGKILRVFGFILKAVWAKFHHRLDSFYFVPAPPKREALYRDFAVLLLCRPFFRRLVLHWHCIGQPAFIEGLSGLERALARFCYGGADLSIPLSRYSEKEAAYFVPKCSALVPNGIPDPCPHFDSELWPRRQREAKERVGDAIGRSGAPRPYNVLFIAGRMTPKGLFDAIEAVILANQKLAEGGSTARVRLTVAGSFEDSTERVQFDDAARLLDTLQVQGSKEPLCIDAGWADNQKKHALYSEADCFLFPTTYPAESFGLVLAEAMAHGCAIITTRWQAVPEVLPAGYPHVLEPHDVEAMAAALLQCMATPADRTLRDYFLAHFTRDRFVTDMVRVLGKDLSESKLAGVG